jgi:pyruvate-formate lyase-activating enzyme
MASLALPFVLPKLKGEGREFNRYFNFLCALRERKRKSQHLQCLPCTLVIDPCTFCKLRCPYCSVGNRSIQRTKGVFPQELHRQMMAELGPYQFLIWYFNTGEPLLNPEFPVMIKQASAREICPIVSTNLSLVLSAEQVDELLLCGLTIVAVSLDGASAETYGRYRRGGDYDLVVSNMVRLVQRKQELGLQYPLIEWRFLVFEHNYHELDHAKMLAQSYKVDLLEMFPGVAPPDAPEGVNAVSSPHIPVPLSGPAFERALSRKDTTLRMLLADEQDHFAMHSGEGLFSQKCDFLYLGAALFPNGSIGPCCVSNDEVFDFGVFDGSLPFRKIWNNEKYQQARGGFSTGAISDVICSQCPAPAAHDYYYVSVLRAVLRNAPDWVLKILAADPQSFFYDIDYQLLPGELGLFRSSVVKITGKFPDIKKKLGTKAKSFPAQSPFINFLLDRL